VHMYNNVSKLLMLF